VLSRSKALLASLLFLSLSTAGFAQEPLSLSDLETLLGSGVAQRRVIDIIKERGINFDLTDTLREKLRKAGADPAIMQSLELAAVRFRLNREAGKLKPEISKREERKADDGRSAVSSPRKLEELPLQIRDKADQVIGLQNLAINESEVSGELVNHSQQPVFGVQLRVLYSWRWNNDFHPGKDDPGRTDYFSVDKEILPRQNVRFSYKPTPPLPQRNDGSFDISVKVVGFSKVFM
jgi:hypothetical protein